MNCSRYMFSIMQLNQPTNDSFQRHLGNYRTQLFTLRMKLHEQNQGVRRGWLVVSTGSEPCGSETLLSENKETIMVWVMMKWEMWWYSIVNCGKTALFRKKAIYTVFSLPLELSKLIIAVCTRQNNHNSCGIQTKAMKNTGWPYKVKGKNKDAKRAIG